MSELAAQTFDFFIISSTFAKSSLNSCESNEGYSFVKSQNVLLKLRKLLWMFLAVFGLGLVQAYAGVEVRDFSLRGVIEGENIRFELLFEADVEGRGLRGTVAALAVVLWAAPTTLNVAS